MVCEAIQSFMAYAADYCLDGRFLRSTNSETPAPYANLRIDACSAETCVEVDRNITFSPGQVRTAQALLHQTDVFLNGSSGEAGSLGLSRSLTTTPFTREAALARLNAYANSHQFPSSCRTNDNCEALTSQQIASIRTALGSNSSSWTNRILGGISAGLGAAYGIHLFHALHKSAEGIPFSSSLGSVLRNDFTGTGKSIVNLGRSALNMFRSCSTSGRLGIGFAALTLGVVAYTTYTHRQEWFS